MRLNIDDEQEVELLHWIFEREFKPPFREDMEDNEYYPYYPYYNRDNKIIGWLYSQLKKFIVRRDPFKYDIKYKVCQVFEFSYNTSDWWYAIKPHLKSWMETQLNIELNDID